MHVPAAVKSNQTADQNVNPHTQKGNPVPQPKYGSQQNQPKTNMPKVNPEPVKPPSESAKPEKPQSKSYTNSSKIYPCICFEC